MSLDFALPPRSCAALEQSHRIISAVIAAHPEAGFAWGSATISSDEPTLLYASTRAGGLGQSDIWIARREARSDGFSSLSPLEPKTSGLRLAGIVKMPSRGHTLAINAGWREVAEKALEFVKRFT